MMYSKDTQDLAPAKSVAKPLLFSALLFAFALADAIEAEAQVRGQERSVQIQALRDKARDKAREYIKSAKLKRGQELDLPVGSKAIKNVSYGSDPAQTLDVYLSSKAKDAPAILMVHGGGWAFGDKGSAGVVGNKAKRWIPKGIALISVNYRMVPKADPLVQAEDVASALAYCQGKAKDWGIDPDRIVLMGHSAGAHLVSLLTADPGIATEKGAKPWLGTVSLDSGAYDVPELMKARHAALFDNAFGKDPEFWKKSSPQFRAKEKMKPMLLVCSSFRKNASVHQSQEFAKKVQGLGGSVEVLPVSLNHGDINKNLGQPGDYTDKVESFLKTLGIL